MCYWSLRWREKVNSLPITQDMVNNYPTFYIDDLATAVKTINNNKRINEPCVLFIN